MPSVDPQQNTRPFLLASRVFAVATSAVIVMSFGTAGVLVQTGELKDIHGAAAIVLHVVSGGLFVALAGLAYTRRRDWWATALAGLVFVYTFIQAALGESATLGVHIAGSLVIVFGTIFVTSWLFSPGRIA